MERGAFPAVKTLRLSEYGFQIAHITVHPKMVIPSYTLASGGIIGYNDFVAHRMHRDRQGKGRAELLILSSPYFARKLI